ncbi:MAG: DUF3471 domain-containing protein, partial [Gemmatimonadales bacterium]
HGKTVWMHTGSIDGMSAIIGLLPEQRVGVYVLANLDHAELRHALMYQVFDLYGDRPPADWSGNLQKLFAARRSARPAAPAQVAAAKPSLALDRYAGTYVDSAYGAINVTLESGALHARYEKADLGPLDAWQYETFRSRPATPEDGPTTLTFVPDGAGGVTSLRAYGQTIVRARTRP